LVGITARIRKKGNDYENGNDDRKRRIHMQQLRTIDEAAGLLRISKWTVRAYIKAGKLRPVRLGRRVLVEETELERFVAEGRDRKKGEVNWAQDETTDPVLCEEEIPEAGRPLTSWKAGINSDSQIVRRDG
jgi:excisionase family DNA binding protein